LDSLKQEQCPTMETLTDFVLSFWSPSDVD
jgi:hypothetical protein